MLKEHIRSIEGFPRAGVIYQDITPLLQNKRVFKSTIDLMLKNINVDNIDLVAGIESRGFIFASALAYAAGKGLIIMRKRGKLPHKVISQDYSLEYGSDAIECHEDAISHKQRILIIDDVLATGGTAKAAINLVEKSGGVVDSLAFIIKIHALDGGEQLKGYKFNSLLSV